MPFFVYAAQLLSTRNWTSLLSADQNFLKTLICRAFSDPHPDPYGEMSLWSHWDKECRRGDRSLVKRAKDAY